MATLIRPTKTEYRLHNRRVPSGTPGATRVRVKASKWYAQGVPGHPSKKRFPLATHKATARQMLAEMVAKAARGLHGLPDTAALSRPLTEHIAAYIAHTETSGAVPKYVATTRHRLTRTAREARFNTATDLLAPGARLKLRQTVAGMTDLSDQTRAHYLISFGSFTRWLCDDAEVLPRNPMVGRRETRGGKGSRRIKQVRGRRPLSPDELARVVAAAAASSRVVRGLDGPSRAALYTVAAGTGLRASELYALTLESFRLGAELPSVFVAGEFTKNGADATIPLPPGVVNMLARFLPGRPAGQRVWSGGWRSHAAEVFAADLEAAGVPRWADTPTGRRVADFHSLRHFFVSALVSAGASVKAAQTLARHSNPALTIGTYSHTDPRELAAAAALVPVATGHAPPSGPFATLSRPELERMAEGLASLVIALAAFPVAPRVAPDTAKTGIGSGQMNTERPRRGNKRTASK